MAEKNKCTKKQRTPRTVANPKRLNRGGSGKPQERRITSPVKVRAICEALEAEALKRLDQAGIELGWTSQKYLDLLIGFKWENLKDEADHASFYAILESEDPKLTRAIQEAFVFAYRLVPDAAFIELPGRGRPFFKSLMDEKDKQQREELKQRKQRHQRTQRPAVTVGHAHVANRIAAASGLR